MSAQKYSVNQHLIETILSWVKSGEIAIPEIQRPFVWDASKVRDLMDSLSSLPLKDISDCDLTRITRDVHLLTREGCAVLEVIQWRAAQES